MFVETGSTISPIFTFSGSTALSSVVIESEIFPAMGFEKTSVDVISERQSLVDKGFGVELSADGKRVVLAWNNRLDDFLKQDGIINIKYLVTDTYDSIAEGNVAKSRELTWRINVSNSNVTAVEVPYRYDIWSYKATLYGTNLEGKTPTGKIYFKYCSKEDGQWSELVEAKFEEGYYKSEITGLKPGTTYQYQIFEDDKPSGVICEFTTEAPVQLPNAGFEKWDEAGKVIYPNEIGASYWDSGNTGATTLGKDYNITTKDASVKHSGEYSANLASRKIITQFAAGNIFIGKYLETVMDGITGHGVLGLGRPFTSRPIALRGYVKYISGNVDKGGDKISNNTPDQGIIYMALTDDRGSAYEYGGEKWSFIIRTKDKQFFSKDNENVIAYGENVWTESTVGEGMHEFIIYFDYDEKQMENQNPDKIAFGCGSK